MLGHDLLAHGHPSHPSTSIRVTQDVGKWFGFGCVGRGQLGGEQCLRQGRSLNNLMAPPRRSIHQSGEQMAQQKGLSKEIAARSLVTLIRAEIHEKQTFSRSEIASAVQEREPPSPVSPAPSRSMRRLSVLLEDQQDLWVSFQGRQGWRLGLCHAHLSHAETAITLNTERLFGGVLLHSA